MAPVEVSDPFTAFSFRVEIWLPGASTPLCNAAFAQCEGLEMRFDVQALREGGSAGRRLFVEPAAPGHVILRRGMTDSFELWQWCTAVARDRGPRADCRVVVLAPDGATERARFRLRGALPVRLRAPDLNATANEVAIEELELAGESMTFEPTTEPDDERVAVERAELRELDPQFEREINPRRWVQAQVNPDSIDLSFVGAAATGGPGAAALTLQLWLDVTAAATRSGRPAADVRRLTEAFAYFITPRRVKGSGLQPPAVRLAWGNFSFDGHMQALRESLELFSPDGRPGRARLDITLSRPWIARPPRRDT